MLHELSLRAVRETISRDPSERGRCHATLMGLRLLAEDEDHRMVVVTKEMRQKWSEREEQQAFDEAWARSLMERTIDAELAGVRSVTWRWLSQISDGDEEARADSMPEAWGGRAGIAE